MCYLQFIAVSSHGHFFEEALVPVIFGTAHKYVPVVRSSAFISHFYWFRTCLRPEDRNYLLLLSRPLLTNSEASSVQGFMMSRDVPELDSRRLYTYTTCQLLHLRRISLLNEWCAFPLGYNSIISNGNRFCN